MAVRNGWPYVDEAVASVLEQTLQDFEFIIIDDASNDKKTTSFFKDIADKRIRLFVNKKQLGLSACLNKGLDAARGKYIARMDHDDISLRERFANQSDFLEAHPGIDILGTWAKVVGQEREQTWRYPVADSEIRAEFLFNSVLVHSSVMMRRSSLKFGLRYDPKVGRAQDYELWTRAAQRLHFANLDQVLLQYRIHSQQVGRLHSKQQQTVASNVRRRQLEWLGLKPNSQQLALHNEISTWRFPKTAAGLTRLEAWLLTIRQQNQENSMFQPIALDRVLERRWWSACRSAIVLGKVAWLLYSKSPLVCKRSIFEKAEFWAKATTHEMSAR